MTFEIATAAKEQPKQTLVDLLRLLSEADQAVLAEFNPADVIGELKDKVDAVKYVLDRLEFQETWCRQQAAPFQKAAQALKRNRDRLEDYVVWAMQQEGFQALPGNVFRAELRNSTPALEMMKPEADALDFEKYPTYVKMVRRYEWDTKAIKDALMAKRREAVAADETIKKERSFAVDAIPFAKLTIGQNAQFPINTPEKLKK